MSGQGLGGPGRAAHLRRLVSARTLSLREGVPLATAEAMRVEEGAAQGFEATPGAADVAGRVEESLLNTLKQAAADEVGDPREYRRALDVFLQASRRLFQRLDAHPDASLSASDALALETVVRADGTRPSLLVRDGRVNWEDPRAGNWGALMAAQAERFMPVAAAVGRVEPQYASPRSYFGTGWVVDASKGLVLTNLHVLEAMRRHPAVVMQPVQERGAGGFRVLAGAFIDFATEAGAERTNRFRIVEATPSGIDGPGFNRLDAAVLQIEPTEQNQAMPAAIVVSASPDGPKGVLDSLCVVGIPGPPPYLAGVHEGVDWTWVIGTLFGNRFGVKRLAPGRAHQPLSQPPDWVFGHDATTLGGSSGSPVLDWAAPAAFGLHFAGATLAGTNYAHAISRCADQLRALGVPVAEG